MKSVRSAIGSAACLTAMVWLAPAGAADWVPVSVPDQHQHSYDRSKLLIDGDSITYWRRVVFRTPQAAKTGMARMALYRERIDCRSHTNHTLGYLLYAQDGAIIENSYTPDAKSEPIVPQTVGDRFELLLCALVKDAQAADQAAAKPGDCASTDALRAEVTRLETRVHELEEQLREASASSSVPAKQ